MTHVQGCAIVESSLHRVLWPHPFGSSWLCVVEACSSLCAWGACSSLCAWGGGGFVRPTTLCYALPTTCTMPQQTQRMSPATLHLNVQLNLFHCPHNFPCTMISGMLLITPAVSFFVSPSHAGLSCHSTHAHTFYAMPQSTMSTYIVFLCFYAG